MHLTLGVMPLRSEQDVERQGEGKTQLHIPSEALTHLHSLRAQIGECLQGEKLRLALGPVETFPSKRWKIRDPSHTAAKEMLSGEAEGMDDGEEDIDMDLSRDAGAAKGEGGKGLAYYKREMADVLFVSVPESDPRNARVWALGRMIEQSFKAAGFITETRPLTLHLTIVNTSHRSPKPPNRHRIQFSYSAMKEVMTSVPPPALPGPEQSTTAAVSGTSRNAAKTGLAEADPGTTESPTEAALNAPHVQNELKLPAQAESLWTDFGTWDIPAVELWVMGSRDAEGRYVSLGGVDLPPARAGEAAE